MNYKIVIFLLYIAPALCNQQSHSHQKRQWSSYNVNAIRRPRFHNNSNITTTPTPIVHNKVNITVYYETLCPASVRFFTNQLKPVVEKLSSHLEIQLVPYGHARTAKLRGGLVFSCQHGPAECHGNKLHACAVDALANNTQAALFNACLMQYTTYRSLRFSSDYVTILHWCGYKLNAPIHGIWECMHSERGSVLLRNYGEATHALRPRYVPYLLVDGSTYDQDFATVNLMSAVCRRLQPKPQPCDQLHRYY